MLSPEASVMETLQMFQNPTVSMCISITLLPFCPSPVKDDLDRFWEKSTSSCWARKQHPHPQYFLSALKNWCVGIRTVFATSAHKLSVMRRMWPHHPDKPPSNVSTEMFFWVEGQIKVGCIFSIFLSRLYFSVLNHQYLWEKGCLLRSVTLLFLTFKFLL